MWSRPDAASGCAAAGQDRVTGRGPGWLAAAGGLGGAGVGRELYRLLLFLGQVVLRLTALDRLGEDARLAPAEERADDKSIALAVEQRDRETLVAAGVAERVESDQSDPLDGALHRLTQLALHRLEIGDALGGLLGQLELAVEQLLEVAAAAAARQPLVLKEHTADPGLEPDVQQQQDDEADQQGDQQDRTEFDE